MSRNTVLTAQPASGRDTERPAASRMRTAMSAKTVLPIRSAVAEPPLSGTDEREADLLLTLAVSFGVDVAVGQRSIEDARAALDYALARALGPSPGAAA